MRCKADGLRFLSRACLKCANARLHFPSVVKGKLASGGGDKGGMRDGEAEGGKEGRR